MKGVRRSVEYQMRHAAKRNWERGESAAAWKWKERADRWEPRGAGWGGFGADRALLRERRTTARKSKAEAVERKRESSKSSLSLAEDGGVGETYEGAAEDDEGDAAEDYSKDKRPSQVKELELDDVSEESPTKSGAHSAELGRSPTMRNNHMGDPDKQQYEDPDAKQVDQREVDSAEAARKWDGHHSDDAEEGVKSTDSSEMFLREQLAEGGEHSGGLGRERGGGEKSERQRRSSISSELKDFRRIHGSFQREEVRREESERRRTTRREQKEREDEEHERRMKMMREDRGGETPDAEEEAGVLTVAQEGVTVPEQGVSPEEVPDRNQSQDSQKNRDLQQDNMSGATDHREGGHSMAIGRFLSPYGGTMRGPTLHEHKDEEWQHGLPRRRASSSNLEGEEPRQPGGSASASSRFSRLPTSRLADWKRRFARAQERWHHRRRKSRGAVYTLRPSPDSKVQFSLLDGVQIRLVDPYGPEEVGPPWIDTIWHRCGGASPSGKKLDDSEAGRTIDGHIIHIPEEKERNKRRTMARSPADKAKSHLEDWNRFLKNLENAFMQWKEGEIKRRREGVEKKKREEEDLKQKVLLKGKEGTVTSWKDSINAFRNQLSDRASQYRRSLKTPTIEIAGLLEFKLVRVPSSTAAEMTSQIRGKNSSLKDASLGIGWTDSDGNRMADEFDPGFHENPDHRARPARFVGLQHLPPLNTRVHFHATHYQFHLLNEGKFNYSNDHCSGWTAEIPRKGENFILFGWVMIVNIYLRAFGLTIIAHLTEGKSMVMIVNKDLSPRAWTD